MNDVVLHGPLLAAAGVAALAGLVSFASPCVLPLVPGFLGYITGMSPEAAGRGGRRHLVTGALLFVAGFSAVFIAMSVVLSGLALALQERQGLLLRVGGLLVIALGLVMVRQPSAAWQPRWRPAAGLAGAPVVGMAFGLGFSACSGPSLAAIQALGASLTPSDDVVRRGLVLAVAYCFGLGMPFVMVAAGLGWVSRASRWLRRHHHGIQAAGGTVLVVLGVLMVTGVWEGVTAWVQTRLTSSFETAL